MPKTEMIALKLGAHSFNKGVLLEYEWETTIQSTLTFPSVEADTEIQKFFTGYLGINRSHVLIVAMVASKLAAILATHYKKETVHPLFPLTHFSLCGAEWSQEFIFYVE